MPNTQYDAIIIGGGPAGLAAGIALAERGLRALVLEHQRLPIDKACGEGVMPTGLAYLERLGVKQHVLPGDFAPFHGIRYLSPGGRAAAARFAEGPGWGIRRTALSRALAQRAAQMPTLEVREGIPALTVNSFNREAGGIGVQAGDEQVQARLLIGADGLNSQVRRWAGLQGPPATRLRWGARQHFGLPPWSEYVEVHWGRGIEAYVTPSGPNVVGVAFLWDSRRFRPDQGGKELFPSLLRSFPALEARLAAAPPCSPPRAVGPLERRVRAVTAEGVLLTGDASGYLDALTGEGISLALAQALALGSTAGTALQGSDGQAAASGSPAVLTAAQLAGYAHAHRNITRPYLRMTRLALWLSRHTTPAEAAITLLGKWPGLFQKVLSLNMGL